MKYIKNVLNFLLILIKILFLGICAPLIALFCIITDSK